MRVKDQVGRSDLPADVNADDLARYVLVIGWGMAIEAQAGGSRKELYCTVEMALKDLQNGGSCEWTNIKEVECIEPDGRVGLIGQAIPGL